MKHTRLFCHAARGTSAARRVRARGGTTRRRNRTHRRPKPPPRRLQHPNPPGYALPIWRGARSRLTNRRRASSHSAQRTAKFYMPSVRATCSLDAANTATIRPRCWTYPPCSPAWRPISSRSSHSPPQVLIMSVMAQTEDQVNQLEQAGIHVVVSDAQNIEGVYTAIGLLGALTGHGTEAELGRRPTCAQSLTRSPRARTNCRAKASTFEVSPLQ